MLLPRRPILSSLLLLPISIQAITLDCEDIRDDGHSFNFKSLGGPKTVHLQEYRTSPPTVSNTTFTIDICKPLSDGDSKKDERCPSGTRVCAKKYDYRNGRDPFLESVIAVAGEFSTSHGSNRALDPKFTRLKGSASNSDNKEGVLVELHGGKFPDDKSGTTQKAVIEFLCAKGVSGNEGFDTKELMSVSEYGSMERRADDDDDGPKLPDLDKGKNLKFVSYKMEEEKQVLRLQWKTERACEDAAQDDSGSKSGGLGFFGWLVVIVFLLIASYIIFGSWLNYNRYGARGWDLIPHGDTIRDIPYLVKDWTVGMADRMKGSGQRGGYSAV